MDRQDKFLQILQERIMILDGAMGTMIQNYSKTVQPLTEADFRGEQFRDHTHSLQGCNDLLSLTRPELIADIHRQFLQAGADILETNTFSATSIAMADYGLEKWVYEMNVESAKLARRVAEEITAQEPNKPRFVAGSMGPTNQTASMSPKVEDPGYRAVTFEQLVSSFSEQIRGLLDGGVDLLLLETNIDTLNLKAELYAVEQVFEERGQRVPVIATITIPDNSGRTLSGQNLEAFWVSISHAPLTAVGINCALGVNEMRPYVEELSQLAHIPTICYPNAGLPNEFGEYDDTPEHMAKVMGEFASEGWLNLAGGCCGTTPAHIAAIAKAVTQHTPRTPSQQRHESCYSGLEALRVRPSTNFLMIGERTNVTGSKRFANLIKSGDYETALSVARQQVEGGANIIDVNMDEGLLDSVAAMTRFLNLMGAEPDIARIPVMIDSSKFEVLEAGLKVLQGKSIVNSISLKEGEEIFKSQARKIRRYGAAVVVMAFDEEGQATDTERRIEILSRAHKILTQEVGFPEEDIIFDPNILTVATGIEEHNTYAISFIEATRELKRLFPHAKVSGGISNISFSFRGNPAVREAMHAAFLYHAIQAGLDMGIVNAGQLEVYEEIVPEMRQLVEDVLFNRREDATDRLIAYAEQNKSGAKERTIDHSWRQGPLADRLAHALLKGITDYLDEDLAEALKVYDQPLQIIEGPLLDGMNIVGDLFGQGKMFLPQVVKSARAMKKAVAFILPHMQQGEDGKQEPRARILLATVKGDVHDIGKNIVGVVLGCNGYEIIDMGVMVPADKILKMAREKKADMIGLSGLITPSLDEMMHVAREMQREGFTMPLLIGGATTSKKHTAVKIAPQYKHTVVHVRDASRSVGVVGELINPESLKRFDEQNRIDQQKARDAFAKKQSLPLEPYSKAIERHFVSDWSQVDIPNPKFLGTHELKDFPLKELVPYIDWSPFFRAWELHGTFPAILKDEVVGETATELFENAQKILNDLMDNKKLTAHAVYGFFPANSQGDDIVLYTDETRTTELTRVHTLRQQRGRQGVPFYALADFIAPKTSDRLDYLGAFCVTAGFGTDELVAHYEADHDDYNAIMVKALADRFAEAFAEYLHKRVREEWGYGQNEDLSNEDLIRERYRGIRPAPGYPACPDHTEKRTLFDLLKVEDTIGVTLTESFAMVPTAAVSGFYFAHPEARYFAVGSINKDQVSEYARRKGMSVKEIEQWLAPNLGYDPSDKD
ncbi:MAG: methionine synthase [Myxococcales bacterium]|nr:methionine synthase [Myxococcales bacterium]